MRVLVCVALAASMSSSASAQQLISGADPGQLLDSVPIVLGMDYDEAVRRVGATFVPEPEMSMDGLATFRRPGEPLHAATIHVLGRDGRVIMVGSTWTPDEASDKAFAVELERLLGLISSQEGAPDCAISVRGPTTGSYIRTTEISCGRQMIHVVRTAQGGGKPNLQLITR